LKIKANNTQDFEKQYYQQFDNRHPFNLNIELETINAFWEEIVKNSYNNSLQSFTDFNKPEFENIKQIFVPKYGTIKRV
jgi:hypothetical protein